MQCLWCNVNWIWVFSSSFLLRALCGADHSKCKNIVHRTECNDEQRLWMRLSKVRHNYSWNNNIMFCICSFSNGLPLTFREAYSCLANNMRIKDDASLLLAMPFSKWSIDLWLNVSEQLNFLKRSTYRFFFLLWMNDLNGSWPFYLPQIIIVVCRFWILNMLSLYHFLCALVSNQNKPLVTGNSQISKPPIRLLAKASIGFVFFFLSPCSIWFLL